MLDFKGKTITLNYVCFLSNRTNFVQRQAFNWLLLASSGPKENVFHSTHKVYQKMYV